MLSLDQLQNKLKRLQTDMKTEIDLIQQRYMKRIEE